MMEKYETDEENLDEVHEDKLTKNSCDAKKSKTIANIKNSVLQWKLSGQAFHIYDELQTIGLQKNNISEIWWGYMAVNILPWAVSSCLAHDSKHDESSNQNPPEHWSCTWKDDHTIWS